MLCPRPGDASCCVLCWAYGAVIYFALLYWLVSYGEAWANSLCVAVHRRVVSLLPGKPFQRTVRAGKV